MMKEMPGMAASFGSSEGYNDIAKDVAKDAFMPAVGSAFNQTTGRVTESIQGGFGRVLDPGAPRPRRRTPSSIPTNSFSNAKRSCV